MPVRDYSGNAKATTLSGAITATATTINVVDGTGYPTGAAGSFVVTLDAGTTSEEKVLCASRTSNTLTVAAGGRGWDGTTAAEHPNAAPVAHTYSATDAREANAHVNDTTGDPHPQYLTPVEGATLYSATGHSHPSGTKTIRLPHTFTISGEVKVASGDTSYIPPFFVAAPPSQTVRLVKMRHRINSGTSATIDIRLNGTAVSGFAGQVVGTAAATVDPADVALPDEGALALVVTAVSGAPKNMSVTLWLEYTI